MAEKKRSPAADTDAGREFYASFNPDLEVRHFSVLWHVVSVGHLAAADLDRIAGRHGRSSADLLLLGALRVAGTPLRATDLALRLNVSNAALSARVTRLAHEKLLDKKRCANDRRSSALQLTSKGANCVDKFIGEISQAGQFTRAFLKLPQADQNSVTRILGDVHDLMEREFLPVRRGEG